MNKKIKEIIDELIYYKEEREPKKYLQEVFDKLGDREIYTLIGSILLWHKLVFLDLESSEKYDISEEKVLQKRFREFFKECDFLNKVFTFKETYIGWSDEISEEEQDEIRKYIHENHKVQVRIRRHKK